MPECVSKKVADCLFDCNHPLDCWTFSAKHSSTTVDCSSFYMSTCTGLMWFAVTVHRCLSTRQSAKVPDRLLHVSLSPTLLVVRDCAQHIVASWTYRDINTAHSAVGYSLSLHQPSGTRFQTSSERRLTTLSGSRWRHYFLHSISGLSALEVIQQLRYINWRFTYLPIKPVYIHTDSMSSLTR